MKRETCFKARPLSPLVAAVVLVLVAASGCSRYTTISSTIQVPPRDPYAVRQIRRLAVVGFGSDHHPRIADAITNQLLQRMIRGRRFEIVERQKVKRIMDEQHFGATDYVNPNSAARIGQILGADHLLLGTVNDFRVEDEHGTFTDIEAVHAGTQRVYVQGRPVEVPQTVQAPVTRRYRVRNASVSLNFRVVDAETGTVRLAESVTRTYTSQRAVDGRALPDRTQLVDDLLEQCIAEIMTWFDYHTMRVETRLSTRHGMSKGVTFFKNGLLEEAEEFFRNKAARNPGSPDPQYNLGVVLETRGDLVGAEEAFKKAFTLDSDNELYQTRLRVVRAKLERR